MRTTVKVTVHSPEGSGAHEQLAVTAHEYQDPTERENGSTRTVRAWSSTIATDDSSQVLDMAFVIVDVDLIVDPER